MPLVQVGIRSAQSSTNPKMFLQGKAKNDEGKEAPAILFDCKEVKAEQLETKSA